MKGMLGFLVGMAMFWNGIILILTIACELTFWSLVFPHTWIGIWIMIEIIRICFNSDIVTITSSEVHVQEETPFSYSRFCCCRSIKSYPCFNDPIFQKVTLTKHVVHDKEDNTDTIYYNVQILQKDGTRATIVHGLKNIEIGEFYLHEFQRIANAQSFEHEENISNSYLTY